MTDILYSFAQITVAKRWCLVSSYHRDNIGYYGDGDKKNNRSQLDEKAFDEVRLAVK